MGLKRCFKCGAEKPLDEFYRHFAMADGHLGKCKDCTKQDTKTDRQTKPSAREYDRQRATLPHRVELRRRVTAEWRHKFPDRKLAAVRAQRAMEQGLIEKPPLCEGCGLGARRLEMHHADYSKPLAVVWLCKPCHAIADKIRRKLEAS